MLSVAPTAEEIRAELERVLSSDTFANAGRLSRLLRFVVERSLVGDGDQLKEYVLGVEVFDRGEQYDPRLDSIVRVEARRLRARLDEYYAGAGAASALRISIPRGTYAPVFAHAGSSEAAITSPPPAAGGSPRDPLLRNLAVLGLAAATIVALVVISWVAFRSTASAEQKPSVIVLPFEQHTGSPDDERLAARLTDGVTSELARLGSVAVVSRTSARQFEGTRLPVRVIAETVQAQFVVEATVERRSGRVRVTPRVVDAATDRKVWADVLEAAPDGAGALTTRIAAQIASVVTRYK